MKTYLRVSLFLWYMWACLRHKALPWNYFQLNSTYFNKKKGIFSKLEIDALIPEQFRLRQYYYDPDQPSEQYPVFIKPEWGQNSKGIIRVNNEKEYRAFQDVAKTSAMPFIVQETAPEKNEFEIYYLRSSENNDNYAFLSITQVTNTGTTIPPINSIHNPCTVYTDITHAFSQKQLKTVWSLLKQIGNFRMARVGLKANNIKNILQEVFHIIEINLFLPMPLVLLAENVELFEKKKIIKKTMSFAVKLVKTIPKNETGEKIFFRKMNAHYKVKK